MKLLAKLILFSEASVSIADRIRYGITWVLSLSPVALVLEGLNWWFANNQQFGVFLSVALLINMLVGAVRHYITHTFTIRDFIVKNIEMGFVIIVAYAMLEMLRYTAGNNVAGEAFRIFIQITTLLYPTSKVFKNLFMITRGKFPPEFIMSKLYRFEKTGDMANLFSTKETPETPEGNGKSN